MQQTPSQYWEIEMHGLRRNAKCFTLIFHTVKKENLQEDKASRRQNDSENVLFLVHH